MVNILHFLVASGMLLTTISSAEQTSRDGKSENSPATAPSTCFDMSTRPTGRNSQIKFSSGRIKSMRQSKIANELNVGYALSAGLSLLNYCRTLDADNAEEERLEAASNAIERALDARHLEVAKHILGREAEFAFVQHSDLNPTFLRFEMAQARTLSFQDRSENALLLRNELEPKVEATFGRLSIESIINQIRICDLELEKGKLDESLAKLAELREKISSNSSFGLQSRILADRAAALALALKGDEAGGLLILQKLRADLLREFDEEEDQLIATDQVITEVLTRMGRYEESLELLSKVFLAESLGGASLDAEQIHTLWHLAFLYLENGRYASASEIARLLFKALHNEAERYEPQLLIQTLSLSADLDFIFGNYVAEVEKRRVVYKNLNDNYGPESIDTEAEGINFALALKRTGQLTEGCALLSVILERITSKSFYDAWSTEYARAGYLACQFDGASQSERKVLLDSFRNSWLRLAERNGDTSIEALTALGSYASASLTAGHYFHAKEALIQLVRLVELARRSTVEGSISRNEAFARWVRTVQDATGPIAGYRHLALLHAQGAELESALRISELARDRGLGDRFAEQEWRRSSLPATARNQLNTLIDRIQDYDERIAFTAEIVERVRLESERTLLVAERGRLERHLREVLHVAETAFRPPTIDDLRAHLATGTALISVLHSGDSWWALVVRRDAAARVVMLSDPDLGPCAQAWVRRLRGDPIRVWPVDGDRLVVQLTRPDRATGPYLTTEELGERLGRSLFVPLESVLGAERHLVFVGDDDLVGVPLQALPRRSGLVLDRYEVSYAPSLTHYARWQEPGRSLRHSRDLLAIGAVNFPHLAPPSTNDPIAVGASFAGEHPLPFARAELARISSLFAAQRTATWIGDRASKTNLRRASQSGELAQYRFVHFATHAWAQPDQPESSAIALAGASNAAPGQGALTAAELAGLQMGSDLLVLSACNTGLGQFEHGRGLLGLAYASLAAGNRAALLSLWPVADDTTADFMERFYTYLRRGMSPPTALAATQRDFQRATNPRHSDPLVWAPFVLYGGY